MTDMDAARICPQCHSGDDVKLVQTLPEKMVYRCMPCKRLWSVTFGHESRPMFPPRPEA